MADSLSLRRYRSADRDRVLELHERAMRDVGAYVEGVPEPDLADVEATYLESGGEFLVGETDGEVVAMGAFRPAGRGLRHGTAGRSQERGEVTRMRVMPARRGRIRNESLIYPCMG